MTVRDIVLAASGVGGTPPSSTDPQFNYVSLLLNDTGTNGAQNNTFLDSSSNNFTITRNGTPTQGSVTPYWPDGQWSNYFNGSSDYVTTPSSASYQFGTGDFTIEAWVYSTSSANRSIIDARGSSSAAPYAFYIDGSNFPYFYDGTVYTSTVAAPPNQWNHVAVSRASGTLRMFVNGVQGFSGTVTTALNPAATFYIGGQNFATPVKFPGYLSNLRIVKGTAVYTSNFTPSTTPLTAVSGTSLLTCQSNRFKDNSSNNFAITVTGTPTVQAFEPFEPASSYATSVGGSGYFNGSGNYLTAADNAAFAFGSGDFTIECWANFSASVSGTGYALVGQGTSAFTSNAGFLFLRHGSNKLRFIYTSDGTGVAGYRITDSTADFLPVVGVWYHLAVSRSGNTFRLFINGVLAGSSTQTTAIFDSTLALAIAADSSGGIPFAGYISNLRIVKGTAVYTSAFTPPTSPVTSITGTSLLLNFTNAGIYDAATLNDLVTVGDAKVSTAQAKFGSSSMAFDGNGDYLSAAYSPLFDLGSSNFTMECWFNASSFASAQTLISKYNYIAPNASGYALRVVNSTTLRFIRGNDVVLDSTVSAMTTGVWYYIAVVRNGSTLTVYLNGTQVGQATGVTNFSDAANQTLQIGRVHTLTDSFNGYIEDVRITKGYARTISTPTAPFPTR